MVIALAPKTQLLTSRLGCERSSNGRQRSRFATFVDITNHGTASMGGNGVQRSGSLSRLSSRADPTLKREPGQLVLSHVVTIARKCNRESHKLSQVCLSYFIVKA